MKNFYLLLVMICSICAFTACSDDKDDPTPTCPVTGYSVPATAVAGSTISIPGTGYVAGAQIILKNSQNLETLASNIEVSATAIGMTIPSSLAAGSYKVILRQSGDWELGTITVEAAGPIEDLNIPEYGAAGEKITIQGKGFNENTKIYLESDELTADELVISDVTASGLTFTIPAILPGGSYRVMLDQGDGIKLGLITITEKTTPCVVSRIVKIQEWGNDSTIFNYTNGKISSIDFKFDEKRYEIDYQSENSIVVTYTPIYDYEFPKTWEYTLENGRVTTAIIKTQEAAYDDQDNELPPVNKTYEYTYEYTPENYLAQINQMPDNSGYDTLFFSYNNGQIQELTRSSSSPVMEPDPDEEITPASVLSTQEIDTYRETYTFSYAKTINNTAAFDVMSVILYNKIVGNDDERLVRMLGIGGKFPTQLPTSYDSYGEHEINYTTLNGYVTKIVFPDVEYPEATETYRIEYQ